MAENYPKNIGKRIGLLGGTFDPVHCGHLALAEAVKSDLALDAIVFVPAFLPPHKQDAPISLFSHRAAMLELAVRNEDNFFVSTVESQREGQSFTCDTLVNFKEQIYPGKRLFFITGADAFLDIHTWKNSKKLLFLADFVVVARSDFHKKYISEYIANTFTDLNCLQKEKLWSSADEQRAIHMVHMPFVDVSSTRIRHLVSLGEDINEMVSEPVREYINTHKLYL